MRPGTGEVCQAQPSLVVQRATGVGWDCHYAAPFFGDAAALVSPSLLAVSWTCVRWLAAVSSEPA